MTPTRANGLAARRPRIGDASQRPLPRLAGASNLAATIAQPEAFSLSNAQFDLIRTLARQCTGIVISDYKRSMILRRVRRRLKALAIASVDDYCALLQGPDGPAELQPFINVLTTNKTAFFREGHHFDHLRDVALPELLGIKSQLRQRRLRIWSAGCSTGEEAWSIAMTVHSAIPRMSDWDVQILATDIDTDVLSTAKDGYYRASDVDAVPASLRAEYFEKAADGPGDYRVTAQLRNLMNFRPLNLHEAWPFRGPIDVIFCRNVVIYFDRPSQRVLYDRFANVLAQSSFLYCGHSESLHGVSKRFDAIGRSIYKRIA